MARVFNVNGGCIPELHYMVDLSERLQKIKMMVDAGQYFTINRARQYGKTTTLQALGEFLKKDYVVASLDFQMMSYADFENEYSFAAAFSREILDNVDDIPESVKADLLGFSENKESRATFSVLFKALTEWCGQSEKRLC